MTSSQLDLTNVKSLARWLQSPLNQFQQQHLVWGPICTHTAMATPMPWWGPQLFPAQNLAENCFPALFLTRTSLHPLPAAMATHLMGLWAKVVATSPALLQPPACPRNPGPGKGQGQPLPCIIPAQCQEAARGKEGRSSLLLPNLSISKNCWLCALVPSRIGKVKLFSEKLPLTETLTGSPFIIPTSNCGWIWEPLNWIICLYFRQKMSHWPKKNNP